MVCFVECAKRMTVAVFENKGVGHDVVGRDLTKFKDLVRLEMEESEGDELVQLPRYNHLIKSGLRCCGLLHYGIPLRKEHPVWESVALQTLSQNAAIIIRKFLLKQQDSF